MKARKKKTRWLLIALLFGFLAVAGLMLTRHQTIAMVTDLAAPEGGPHLDAAPLASIGAEDVFTAPDGAPSHHEGFGGVHSNNPPPHVTDHAGSPSHASTGIGVTPGGHAAGLPAGTSAGTQPQGSPPHRGTGIAPQPGAGEYAYNGFVPLDCELPAGCGAPGGNTGHGSRQPSGTSGVVPVAHNSQGSSPPNDGSDPPASSDPSDPGSNPPLASAPELDPATLAGAVTLLLGALAVLRSRRVRVSA